MKKSHARFMIWVTFLLALLLNILPFPSWIRWLMPQWTLLVFFYWALALPYAVNVGVAFSLGLLMDLLNGTMIGEHALAMVLVAYFIIKLHQIMRMYPFFQQGIMVSILTFVYLAILFAIQGVLCHVPHSLLYWLSAITTGLLWPWVFVLLRDLRRGMNIT